MPIDEIGVGIFGAIFRFLGWVFFEVIIEVLIKGLGYVICRPFKKVGVDSTASAIVGFIVCGVIIVSVILISGWFSENTEID